MTKTNYMKKNIRVAIYVRVSTQEQAKEGYSIGEQTDRLKKFADAHDWIVVKVYTDAGHSGADTNRPALQNMLKDIRNGKIDKVLVYKLDRLSRSQKDTLSLIEDEFLPHNTDFESMSEKLDTSTPQGRLFLGILAAFAQLEREVIKERMSMGINARIKEGKWRGGAQVPFGYDYEPAIGHLVINEYESIIVKELFDQFASGKKLRTIAREFEDKGFLLRNGKVDTRSLRYIMANKTYCGYLRTKNEWIKGKHDAIIDLETYETVNQIMDKNRENDMRRNPRNSGIKAHSTYLGGLLHCSHCGGKYSKCLSGHKAYGYNNMYSCYSRHKKVRSMIMDPNCKNKNYREEVLNEIIFNEIRKLAIDPEYIHSLREQHQKGENEIQAIQSKLKEIDTQVSRFMDLYGLGRFTIEELDKKVIPLKEEEEKLRTELKRIEEESTKLPEEKAIELVNSFDDVLKKGSLEDVRTVLEQLISRIDIDNDDITIHWNFV